MSFNQNRYLDRGTYSFPLILFIRLIYYLADNLLSMHVLKNTFSDGYTDTTTLVSLKVSLG